MATIDTLTGGAFQDSGGNILANGTIKFQLSSPALVNDSQVVPNIPIIFSLDGSGNITSGSKLWGNDVLTPSGTYYTVSIYGASGNLARGPESWIIAGTSPIDLGGITPSTPAVSYSGAVLLNPVGNQTIASGNLTIDSALTVVGATTLQNASVSGTLGVTGAATLSGNATVGGTLGVTGAATLSGNASVGGTLAVTGAATLSTASASGLVTGTRYSGHNSSALTNANFAASANWGTSPVIAIVSGTDSGANVLIQAKATTGASPTLTLTFHDGTWTNTPVVVCSRSDTQAATGAPTASVTNQWVVSSISATSVVFTFVGTPVANTTYGLSFITLGT